MSKKCRDVKGRWRRLTVSFRVSPEENQTIHDMARAAGMTKQDYCIDRLLNREITVSRNPRVYVGLKGLMEGICTELKRIADATEVTDETMEKLNMITEIYRRMGEEKDA